MATSASPSSESRPWPPGRPASPPSRHQSSTVFAPPLSAIMIVRYDSSSPTHFFLLYYGLLLSLALVPPPTTMAIRTRVTWVNGIAHNLDHMHDGRDGISSLFGGSPVEFCHNPTSMTSEDDYVGWGKDLTQAGTQKLGRITEEVDALVSHLKDAVSRVGPAGVVVHIAHSQGALITLLAARRLPPSDLSRIEVISFGGGAALRRSPETPFKRCVNYYSANDPILAIVPSAERALRSGFLGVCSGTGLPSEEPEFVFLTPRANDPVADHGLLGPTYGEALEWEGRRFQRLYLPLHARAGRAAMAGTVAALGGLSESTREVLIAALGRTVVPFVMFVMEVNARVTRMTTELVRSVWVAVWMALRFVWEVLMEVLRAWRGEEEKYVPVSRPNAR